MKKRYKILCILFVFVLLMGMLTTSSFARTADTRPVRTITLDTRSYNMAPKKVYTFLAKLAGPGVKQADVKVYSSRNTVAAVKQIGRSNLYRITGIKPGVTYVIAEIGSTHASIKVTVRAGLKKAYGESCRSTSIIPYTTPIPDPPSHKFKVYLSPSCQLANHYVNGGTEEENMRKIAYAMVPYLKKAQIPYVLAPEKHAVPTASWNNILVLRAREASATKCDLYFAIHSNAYDGGPRQGSLVLYYSKDRVGKDLAEIIRDNYIYPDNSKVLLATNDKLIDMWCPSMTSLLIETAYHDNLDDANWIKENVDPIAANLVDCISKYRAKHYPDSVPKDTTKP